jgi:hypothetical protein
MLDITLGGDYENAQRPDGCGPGDNTSRLSTSDVTLNTTDASIGNVINTRQLTELQFDSNRRAALMSLQAGVVGNLGTTSGNRVGSVTGSRADQATSRLTVLMPRSDTGQALPRSETPRSTHQEPISTNLSAGEGRSSGGQIELVTKSGSNNFHGNVREYNRTAATASNSFFNNKSGIAKPQLTRNQFGASLGGPVYLPRFGEGGPAIYKGKDRLFFFFDYEGRRDAQELLLADSPRTTYKMVV